MKRAKIGIWVALLVCLAMAPVFGAGTQEKSSSVPTVGFTNMADSIEFCMLVKQGLEAECKARGWNFLALDNELDGQKAVQNTDILVQREVDFAVIFNIDAATQPVVSSKLKDAGIPAVGIDIYLPEYPFFGVDNAIAGEMGGKYIGEYARDNWGKEPDLYVILDNPMGGQYAKDRSDACERGLYSVYPNFPADKLVRVDAKADVLEAKKIMADVLTAHPAAVNIAVTGINDQVCNGGLAAIEEAGRDKGALVVSLGADTSFLQNLKATEGKGPWKAAVLFGPELYGAQIVPLIEQVFDGKELPMLNTVNHAIIDKDTVGAFYPEFAW